MVSQLCIAEDSYCQSVAIPPLALQDSHRLMSIPPLLIPCSNAGAAIIVAIMLSAAFIPDEHCNLGPGPAHPVW